MASTESKKVSLEQISSLREATGAGVLLCKEALAATDGNQEEAVKYLRKKGLSLAEKKVGRNASEGVIEAYIHGKNLGILVELNCETDFVARRDDFKELARNLAMQVAACPNVDYVSIDDIDEAIVQRETEIENNKPDLEGKPEDIKQNIITNRVKKTLGQMCLLEQNYIKDSSMTVGELIKQNTAVIGENIQFRRFVRFNLGETLN